MAIINKEEKTRQQKKIEHTKEQKEIGGPKGPEPTRYGDWESKVRVSDF